MATTTTNFGLTKPAKSDYYDIAVPNANMDIIDAQLKANADSLASKLDKTGDGSNVTAMFTQAATRANITSGEKHSVLFGKIAKLFADLGTAAFQAATAFAAAVHTHVKADIKDFAHTHVKTDVIDFPLSMAPTAHKSTHSTGGADALTPSDIGAAILSSGTATLSTSAWTGSTAPYTYTITATGVLDSDRPHISCILNHSDRAADKLIQAEWTKAVSAGAKSANGQIILYADAKPTVAIPMQWEVIR